MSAVPEGITSADVIVLALAAARNCQQAPGAPHAHFGNQHPNETSMTALLVRKRLGSQRPDNIATT
jgi:hypothetical protein